ncbi:hypothetical protein C8N40_108165 [Pontibacter mucosus]|uniref:Uncharacterized protein n=1 Tax=Pontibacter mucosus TaxID=1649266 RepID=A0A2T5YEY0_9BACT|nr:hypothetical protein [Pontibacter mucosus]PTX15273.1 hypothetical protein C8N40_108165 [Pontibacter mucosus]
MRRHRRTSTGAISDTWNYSLNSVSDNLGFTHEFTDALEQGLLDEERILRKHRLEKEHKAEEPIYPSCPLDEKPTTDVV